MGHVSPRRDSILARPRSRAQRQTRIGIRILGAILALSGICLAQSSRPAASAANASSAKAGSSNSQAFNAHDFSGVWDPAPYMQPKGEVNPLDLGGNPNPLPPFSPQGRAAYETNKKFISAGDVTSCDPYGTARNFFTPRPFEVIDARDRVLQHFEYYDNWREIWTDGRGFPPDLEPDYMGYSLGKWDGDTFVVESQGYNGKQFLTWQGFPIGTDMHQTERWQRVDRDTLKIVFTFDDPKNYAKPWSITYFYKLKDWQLDAHPCTVSELKEWDERMGHVDGLAGLDYGGKQPASNK